MNHFIWFKWFLSCDMIGPWDTVYNAVYDTVYNAVYDTVYNAVYDTVYPHEL